MNEKKLLSAALEKAKNGVTESEILDFVFTKCNTYRVGVRVAHHIFFFLKEAQASLNFFIMKKKMLKQLKSQQLELISLINVACISSIGGHDNGQLNNLQRALKLNQDLIKLVEDE